MEEIKSRLQREAHTSKVKGFVEGVNCTKEIIVNELKDSIQNGTIVIEKGADKLFQIIESVGKI